MSFERYLLLVAGMGLVTYLPRWLPLFALARRRLPRELVEWLGFIPAALLAALVAPALFLDGTGPSLTLAKTELWVAVPTLLFALKTRSLAGTVLVGMAVFWLAGNLG